MKAVFTILVLALALSQHASAMKPPRGVLRNELCRSFTETCDVGPVLFQNCKDQVFAIYGWATFGGRTYKASSPDFDGQTLTVYLNGYGEVSCPSKRSNGQ